jgi:hypothetical protein
MEVIIIQKSIKCIEEENLYIFDEEELEELKSLNLIHSKKKTYRFELNNKRYSLDCPLKLVNGEVLGVYLPAEKSPYRPYPCYVYLYAVFLYLNADSMRSAAKKTGKRFGIPKFSHSTISRVLRKILSHLEDLQNLQIVSTKANTSMDQSNSYTILKEILSRISEDIESMTHIIYEFFKKYQKLLI